MPWYVDETDGSVHKTAEITGPGGHPTRMNRRVWENPDRYKEMTEAQVTSHLKKVNKSRKEEGLPPIDESGNVAPAAEEKSSEGPK